MSDYLQRLFDRGADAAAPAVAPAGVSLSPIALQDQRLNDPSMLGLIGLAYPASGAFEVADDFGESDMRGAPGERPTPPAAQRPAQPPSALPRATPPAEPTTRPAASPSARAATAALEPGVQRPRAAPPPFVRFGAVAETDFVRPDVPASELGEPPGRPTPQTVSRGRQAPEAQPSPPPAQPTATPATSSRTGEALAPAHSPAGERAAAAPPSTRAAPPGVDPQSPSSQRPAPTPTAPLPAVQTAMPLPPGPPPPLEPPRDTERTRVVETQRETVVTQQREQLKTVREAPAAAPRRPMTAAEASLIGPLTPSRSGSLFLGVRRR